MGVILNPNLGEPLMAEVRVDRLVLNTQHLKMVKFFILTVNAIDT